VLQVVRIGSNQGPQSRQPQFEAFRLRDGLSANVTGQLNFSAGWRSPTVGVENPNLIA
jgi:hypothetical protein